MNAQFVTGPNESGDLNPMGRKMFEGILRHCERTADHACEETRLSRSIATARAEKRPKPEFLVLLTHVHAFPCLSSWHRT